MSVCVRLHWESDKPSLVRIGRDCRAWACFTSRQFKQRGTSKTSVSCRTVAPTESNESENPLRKLLSSRTSHNLT